MQTAVFLARNPTFNSILVVPTTTCSNVDAAGTSLELIKAHHPAGAMIIRLRIFDR
jgi:hypothetical protein